jgi:CRISPR/Cas system-associated protein Cas10 (large subunit of type III CRISPR-Cas system)
LGGLSPELKHRNHKEINEMATKLNNTLSLQEVIDELEELKEEYGPDAQVVFGCDYGDICHTQQALQINQVEAVNANKIAESAYSNSGFAISDDNYIIVLQ